MIGCLKTGRNCIALGSAALKLYAQRRITARLVDDERIKAVDEREGDTD